MHFTSSGLLSFDANVLVLLSAKSRASGGEPALRISQPSAPGPATRYIGFH